MKPIRILTKSQEDFIKNNYMELSDAELSEGVCLTIPIVQQLRIKWNLRKQKRPEPRRKVNTDGNFYVSERENWLI